MCFAGKRIALSNDSVANTADLVPCENCGKLDSKTKLKKKPFCSAICAKTAKTSPEMEQPIPMDVAQEIDPKLEKISEDPIRSTSLPSATPATNNVQPLAVVSEPPACQTVKPLAPTDSPATGVAADNGDQGPQLHKWTVSEVCEFIRNLPGCSDYAEDFENQEIDGQALLLLKPNNLVSVMGIKLGPALKIIDRVNVMRGGSQDD